MRNEPFEAPVRIRTMKSGRYRVLNDTAEAALFLVDQWPEARGPKYRSALKAMMDAMEGRKAVTSARRALIAAAREAKLQTR
jgi:hypothetical protein